MINAPKRALKEQLGQALTNEELRHVEQEPIRTRTDFNSWSDGDIKKHKQKLAADRQQKFCKKPEKQTGLSRGNNNSNNSRSDHDDDDDHIDSSVA